VTFRGDRSRPWRASDSEVRAGPIALAGVQKESPGSQRTTLEVLNEQQDLIRAKGEHDPSATRPAWCSLHAAERDRPARRESAGAEDADYQAEPITTGTRLWHGCARGGAIGRLTRTTAPARLMAWSVSRAGARNSAISTGQRARMTICASVMPPTTTIARRCLHMQTRCARERRRQQPDAGDPRRLIQHRTHLQSPVRSTGGAVRSRLRSAVNCDR